MLGMPETKQMDGETWHWCAHCGFWHLSHGTVGHKDLSMLPPQTKMKNNSTASTFIAISKTTNSNPGLQFCGNCMFGNE